MPQTVHVQINMRTETPERQAEIRRKVFALKAVNVAVYEITWQTSRFWHLVTPENVHNLARQYFPHRTGTSGISDADLKDAIDYYLTYLLPVQRESELDV